MLICKSNILASGAAQLTASTTAFQSFVHLKADANNTKIVVVGFASTVTGDLTPAVTTGDATNGFQLNPGDEVFVHAKDFDDAGAARNPSTIWLRAVGGDGQRIYARSV